MKIEKESAAMEENHIEAEQASNVVRNRLLSYALVSGALIAGGIYARSISWTSSTHFHTNLEIVATLLSLFVGVMAFVHYYTRKDLKLLLIAAGFFGTASLDGYHAIVTSAFFNEFFPSEASTLAPWSWIASRLYLSVLLWLSIFSWDIKGAGLKDDKTNERYVFAVVALLTLSSFLIFAFVPMPRAHYPEYLTHRPQEFLPAVFFAMALFGYWRKGGWKTNLLDHWLMLSILVGLLCQTVFMSFSSEVYDAEFDLAHALKKVSYTCVLSGLLLNMYRVFATERETEQMYKSMAETVQGAMFQYYYRSADDHGPVYVSQRCKDVLKLDAAELQQDWSLLQPHEAESERYRHDVFKAMERGDEFDYEGRFQVKKRETLWLHMLAAPRPSKKYGTLYTGLIIDIEKQKRYAESKFIEIANKLKNSNETLEQFAYVASHDLKAPMRGIDNACLWLEQDLKDKLDDEGRQLLGLMRSRINRLQTFLDDLLAYSRAGRVREDAKYVDTHALLEEISDLLVGDGKIQVKLVQPLPKIKIIELELRQVLHNLIQNAIKHHDKPNGTIEVSAKERGDFVEFTVADDGPGIEPEYQEQVFALFKTLKRRDEVEGTGMGLAIVKKLVEVNGGKVTVDSQGQGAGTRFVFTWPREIKDEQRSDNYEFLAA